MVNEPLTNERAVHRTCKFCFDYFAVLIVDIVLENFECLPFAGFSARAWLRWFYKGAWPGRVMIVLGGSVNRLAMSGL
jgi:hypothetical protein